MTGNVGVMSDDLRDLIAAVICGMDALHAEKWSLDVADAVIAALKEDGFIVSVMRHDYGQPRASVFSAIRDFDRGSIDREQWLMGDDYQP